MSRHNITFRPATDDDLPLLKQIYFSTREEEMKLAKHWSDDEKTAFLEHQFNAQHTFYHAEWPDAQYDLMLKDGEPVGRLYLDRREEEFRVMDIALLPEHQRLGIGGQIMQDILDEAAAVGKKVGIHVEMNNPAMSLYKRLGFEKIEEHGIYYFMLWYPEGMEQEAAADDQAESAETDEGQAAENEGRQAGETDEGEAEPEDA